MLKDLEIAHIAVAVPKLAESLKAFSDVLGLKASAPEEVKDQKVRLQFVTIGGVRFEFVEPTSPDSPISKFLEKKGQGIHHIALKVKGIEEVLNTLKSRGVQLIDEKPRVGAEDCLIAFIHPKSTGGILIELVEERH